MSENEVDALVTCPTLSLNPVSACTEEVENEGLELSAAQVQLADSLSRPEAFLCCMLLSLPTLGFFSLSRFLAAAKRTTQEIIQAAQDDEGEEN